MNLNRLRLLYVLTIAVCFGVQMSFAQSDSSNSGTSFPYYMMDFGVRSNFTVGSFLGPALSLSRVVDPVTRWRFGIGASISPYEGDEIQDRYYADTLLNTGTRSFSGASYSISFVAQKLHFAPTSSVMHMYGGWGPIVSGTYSVRDDDETSSTPSGSTSRNRIERREYTWLIGVSGVAGVEWQFSPGMVLHAEYGVQANYSRSSYKETSIQTFDVNPPSEYQRDRSTWGVGLISSGVLFGLSIAI